LIALRREQASLIRIERMPSGTVSGTVSGTMSGTMEASGKRAVSR
jgi:hypothetical protein